MFNSGCLALFFSCCKKSNETPGEQEERKFLLAPEVSGKYSIPMTKPKQSFSQLMAEVQQRYTKVTEIKAEQDKLPLDALDKRQALAEELVAARSACADTEAKVTQIMQLVTDRLQERESGDGIKLGEDSNDSDGLNIDKDGDYVLVASSQTPPSSPFVCKMR